MKYPRFWLGLAAPALLLAAGPALSEQSPALAQKRLAQQTVQPRTADPRAVNESNQTRELESQIEQYPGPNEGMRIDGEPETRIPEQMQPSPAKPSPARPRAGSPSAPAGGAASSIDPSEVQRVFGTDARVISLASLDAASITRLQVRLNELGHYKGTIDGVMGPQTRAAIGAYARAELALKQRLLKQDQLTPDLAEQLGVQSSAPHTHPPADGDTGPSMGGDSPLLPPGGAPLPPPGMVPLPTPSSAPGGVPPVRSGATPAPPPPSP